MGANNLGKYGFWRKVKRLKAIFKSIKSGNSISAACKAAQLDVSTLWDWRQINPRLDAKILKMIDGRVQMVEDALFKTALEGNVTAQLAFLFNRADYRWRDKRNFTQQNQNTTVVNKIDLKGASIDDLRKIISLAETIDQEDSSRSEERISQTSDQ